MSAYTHRTTERAKWALEYVIGPRVTKPGEEPWNILADVIAERDALLAALIGVAGLTHDANGVPTNGLCWCDARGDEPHAQECEDARKAVEGTP